MTAVGTDFYIHYLQQPNGGSFRWKIDSGGYTTVSTANASSSFQSVAITGQTAGSHTLTLQVTVAGSAGVTIAGMDCQYSAPGARIHNLGISGSDTANWLTQNATIWEASIAALSPNTVCILLGVNDKGGNVVPATYAANLAALVARIQVAVPLADIVFVSPFDIGTSNAYPMINYVDAMRTQAAASGVAFIDNYKLSGLYANANSRGLMANTSHPNADGGNLIASYIASFLGVNTGLQDVRVLSSGAVTPIHNLGVGPLTLTGLTSGASNTAFGYGAVQYATTGSFNLGFGDSSLNALTTGSRNIAIGYWALVSQTTGSDNIAIGDSALRGSTDGLENVAIGRNALRSLASANDNVAVGYSAMSTNVVSGANNTGVGRQAQTSLTGGSNNTSIGALALLVNLNGSENTGIGYGAGQAVAGSNNTMVGSRAGTVTNGSGNVMLGYYAGHYASASSNEFYVDNQDRTDTAGDKASALMYGTFSATPASQTLRFNVGTFSVLGITPVSTDTLSGAGAISVTKDTTKLTTSGVGQALTLADGVDGQKKTILHDVDGGSAVLTATTKTGWSTATFTNAGDTLSLEFATTRGWFVIGSYGTVVAP